MWKLKGAARWRALPLWCLLAAPALWLAATDMLMETLWPRTDSLYNDWRAHLQSAGMFAAGILLAARGDAWRWLEARRTALLGLTLLLGVALLADHALWLKGALTAPWSGISYYAIVGVFGWSMILTLCGTATHYLNTPSALLTYLNTAILPVYVLHQPILFLAAAAIFPLRLPLGIEAALLITITLTVALALYHFAIRPFAVMRFCFGLKAAR